MRKHRYLAILLTMILVASATVIHGQWNAVERHDLQGPQAASQIQTPGNQEVPADLRPLLAPRQSEMRLVTQHYIADRSTLNGNYDWGGAGGRGGRGAGAGGVPGLSLSTNRIARLKRYDLDWQAALAKLDASRLSAAAQAELNLLKTTIRTNLTQLDADAGAIAQVMPLLPFARPIIELSEARMRMQDIDAKEAGGVLTEVTKRIGRMRAGLTEALGGATSAAAGLRVGKDVAIRGADAVDGLRGSLATWFNFYNGYDPLFMWWTALPYKHVNTALQEYAAFLREKVAAANQTPNVVSPAAPVIAPAPAQKIKDVPDLQGLLALPQDEMADIVQRFLGRDGGGRGGRGGAIAATGPRNPRYFADWLAALKTLDFNGLSRNAQVDYLFIRKRCEIQIAREGLKPQADIPRKTDNSGITGAARGRDGLIVDLQDEMIPYTPEELIAIANREFAWCDAEKKKAAQQMGFGDDWQKALEKAKEMHVPPGEQPGVIRDLLFEAIDYLRAKDILTIPQVAGESLHMVMMSPERQLVNPFFTGGAQISVSYPTDTMEYEARLQSMRGNSTPLSHATAFHEMIPGHNFVGYMGARYSGYRTRLGGTSFYGEGWPLYWEMMMYRMGFHDTPEEKTGALFWRAHRCARIIFSLKFHMGEWSPQECVDFLVDRVGFERDNAIGEVRRSFQGGYGPLYQAAYLLGGLQLRSLREELVDSGQMPEKQFHDEIMRQGSMPIAMLRLAISKQKLTRDMPVDWKFYGDNPGK
jgi:uncharacterized protein (DUF885 family)